MTPRVADSQDLAVTGVASYVKAIRELGAVGALIAIALYMVFRLLSGVPTSADVADVKKTLDTHVSTTNEQLVNVRYLLRAICFNTAKDDNARASCQGGER